MITFDQVISHLDICQFPICVETGTAYCFPSNDPYWNTTSSIVKRLCEPLNGNLISIDLLDRSENINKLFSFGELDRSRVSLIVGNSVDVLKKLWIPRIDLLCLDSGEDEDLLLNEYLIAKPLLSKKHYVLVDDIHNGGSVKYKKVVPHLKKLGYDWLEFSTETGLFVSSVGYDLGGLHWQTQGK